MGLRVAGCIGGDRAAQGAAKEDHPLGVYVGAAQHVVERCLRIQLQALQQGRGAWAEQGQKNGEQARRQAGRQRTVSTRAKGLLSRRRQGLGAHAAAEAEGVEEGSAAHPLSG